MKKHKCCSNKFGQYIEFEFLDLNEIFLNNYDNEGTFCFGKAITTFSGGTTIYSDGYKDERESSTIDVWRPHPRNTITRISQGETKVNTTVRGGVCDSEYYSKSSKFQTRYTGSHRHIQKTKEPWRNPNTGKMECFKDTKIFDYPEGIAGLIRGDCYRKSQLKNLEYSKTEINVNDNPVSGALTHQSNYFYRYTALTGGVYYPPGSQEPIILPNIKSCFNINFNNFEFSKGIIIQEQNNIIIISTINADIKYEFKKRKDTKLLNYKFGSCGCAKNEIECKINGKICCIDCCKIAENVYKKYTE